MSIVESIVSFRGEKGGSVYWLCRLLTELGFVYVIVAIIIVILIIRKVDLKSIFLGLGVLTTYIVNMIVKVIVRRERPPLEYRWMSESSMSYPSSHTMCTTFFYGFLAYILLTSNLPKKVKYPLVSLCGIIIPVVATTRLILSVHYFSDVIGGFIFGLALLFGAILLYEFLFNKGYDGFKKLILKKKEAK